MFLRVMCPLFLVIVAFLLTVQASPVSAGPAKSAPTGEAGMAGLKDGLNQFSMDMYKHIASSSDNSTNVFFSPISIASSLLLVYAGAKGDTAKELAQAMHFFTETQEPTAILNSFHSLSQVFHPSSEKNYSLNLANRIYLEETFHAKDDYKVIVQSKLNSSIETVDFKDRPEDARKEINQWVELQTSGKIKNLATEDNANKHTIVVLINAIYFKARWANVFDPAMTKPGNFTIQDGSTSQVPMMEKRNMALRYHNNMDGTKNGLPPFHMISLPYEGGELSFWVLLPKDADGLPALEKRLTAETLGKAMENAEKGMRINLKMPKLKLEESYNLEDGLKAMGVAKIFEGGDLSGITDDPLKVSSVVHKAFVDINEESTEAAAATFVQMNYAQSAVIEPEPQNFFVDHPFIFAIRHDLSGLLVFLGRVSNF